MGRFRGRFAGLANAESGTASKGGAGSLPSLCSLLHMPQRELGRTSCRWFTVSPARETRFLDSDPCCGGAVCAVRACEPLAKSGPPHGTSDPSGIRSALDYWRLDSYRDEVVPFWHGQELFLGTPTKWRAKPFWVDGAGHNNIEALLR